MELGYQDSWGAGLQIQPMHHTASQGSQCSGSVERGTGLVPSDPVLGLSLISSKLYFSLELSFLICKMG